MREYDTLWLQSPYGAIPVATPHNKKNEVDALGGCNPLTGLFQLQQKVEIILTNDLDAVAIPLRGYSSCNGMVCERRPGRGS